MQRALDAAWRFFEQGDTEGVRRVIEEEMQPIKEAVEAAQGAAEADEHPVSFGIQAEGPSLTRGPSTPEGWSVSATLTVRF